MPNLAIRNQSIDYPTLGGESPDAIRLGRYFDQSKNTVTHRMGYDDELNLLLFGPNGSGKGMRILVQNLLQSAGRSIFVLDPKGELAAITAPYRRKVSDVIIINPFGLFVDRPGYEDLKSAGYNPFDTLDPDAPSFNRDAAQLAQALVTISGRDEHWDASARALLAAIIMFVVLESKNRLSPDILSMAGLDTEPGRQSNGPATMARVRELLCLASEKANAANEYVGVGIPALCLAMMKTSLAGLRNKASQFTSWTNEIQSIASAARRQTEPFDDTEIAEDLAREGFRMSSLKERPVTIYLVLHPDHMERHSKWLRLIVTCALQAVMRVREAHEPRVLFMLDEMAALGHMEIIENVWAVVRGYGIQIMPVFQDLNQLQGIYKERWETFIGQAGVITFFRPNNSTTAKWISERAGETTRDVESRNSTSSMSTTTGSSSGGSSNSSSNSTTHTFAESYSAQPTKVPFIQPHSLYGMREGATISFLAGVSNAVPGYAPPYWDIAQCVERARANPYYQARQDPLRISASNQSPMTELRLTTGASGVPEIVPR